MHISGEKMKDKTEPLVPSTRSKAFLGSIGWEFGKVLLSGGLQTPSIYRSERGGFTEKCCSQRNHACHQQKKSVRRRFPRRSIAYMHQVMPTLPLVSLEFRFVTPLYRTKPLAYLSFPWRSALVPSAPEVRTSHFFSDLHVVLPHLHTSHHLSPFPPTSFLHLFVKSHSPGV